jgi:hypothetical protein
LRPWVAVPGRARAAAVPGVREQGHSRQAELEGARHGCVAWAVKARDGRAGAQYDTRMDNINIHRSAKLYIYRYGVNASVRAAMTADALLAHDDLEGFNTWMRIGRAIEDLQATADRTTL